MNNISMKSPRRVANKIILLVLSLELLSLILWGLMTYSGSRDELMHSKSSQLNEIASSTKIKIDGFFLPSFIETDVVSSALTNEDNRLTDKLNSSLYSFMNRRSEVEELSIIDSDKNEIKHISRMTGAAKSESRNFVNDPLITNSFLGRRSISQVKFSEYLEPKVRVATHVKSDNGAEQVILTVINLKWLWDTLESLRVEQTGNVYVVNESLILVAHPDPSLVLSRTNMRDTAIPQSLFSNNGHKNLQIYENTTGQTVAGISHFDPAYGWWIVVEQPIDEALAPLDRVINRFILAFLLVSILTVVTVVYFSKLMMRPLQSLEFAIAKLTNGDRDIRVEIQANTELSSLSAAFNKMAANLDEKADKLEYQAYHDDLTKLPNRKRLFEHIDAILKDRLQDNKPFAVLLLDLDRFKEINDSLGHKCGDLLLRELSGRLLSVVPENELVARLGGDEFAVVIESADNVAKAKQVARNLKKVIQKHFQLEGLGLLIDASVGIALYPIDGIDSTMLMRRADVAMYYAKKSGLGISTYDEDFDTNNPQKLAIISGLSRAIVENELVLHYQPQIRVHDKKVIGVEALIRWNHPEHGLLMPDQFIPIVELSNSIIELTNWVMNQALLDCKKWHDLGADFGIAVNVSTINIQDEEFVYHLNELILKHKVSPNKIQLEITESIILADTKRALKSINELDEMGIKIAIDDFGTGYSSLAHLRELPVDELKIDKSFVMDVEHNENDAVIVRSTIDLAHNLGLAVTAEGVETEGALSLLESLDCEFAQGYYISRPIPADKILSWTKEWESKNMSCANTSSFT